MANGTTIAKAYVQIVPSTTGIVGTLKSELSGEAESAGTSAGSSLAGAMKGAIAAAGVGLAVKKVFSEAFSEGAALQQSMGGVETMFKDSADIVKGYAEQAYQTAGLSANEYMEQVTSFSASLLQSLDGDTGRAAEAANQAVIDMSDNANKFGTDIQSIQNAYQGFAKGNFTMLDNLKLGYGGTKTEMERLLADASKLSGVEYNIDSLDDMYSAIHVIQTELGVTGTTAEEASTTWSGSLASMQSAYKNLMGALMTGEDLGPAISGLVSTVSTFVIDNLFPAVGNIITALPGAIIGFVEGILPQVSEMAGGLIETVCNGLQNNLPKILTSAAEIVMKLISGIVTHLPQILEGGIRIIGSLVTGIAKALPDVVRTIKDTFTGIDWLDVGRNIIEGVKNGLVAAGHMLWDAVKGILGSFKDNVLGFFGIHSPSRWGIWVGKMIDEGFAGGIEGNASAVDKAMESITGAVSDPFGSVSSINSRVMSSQVNTQQSGVEGIYKLLKDYVANGKDIYINDTKVASAMYSANQKEAQRMTKINRMISGVV